MLSMSCCFPGNLNGLAHASQDMHMLDQQYGACCGIGNQRAEGVSSLSYAPLRPCKGTNGLSVDIKHYVAAMALSLGLEKLTYWQWHGAWLVHPRGSHLLLAF